jgi:perosamine synthetase
MTAETIERALTRKTRAIVLVHLNGHPADPDAVANLARQHGITLIEDCAQAHGARWNGQLVGTFGALGTYSFWEDKIMTTAGEGGMIVTDDDDFAFQARTVLNHGEAPTDENYYAGERLYFHERLGYNFRMTELAGAVGLVQLGRLEAYLHRRTELAAHLTALLSDVPGVLPPLIQPQAFHAFYKYIILLDRTLTSVSVVDFVNALRAEGIPATRRYPTCIHQQPIFLDRRGFGTTHWPFPDEPTAPPILPVAEAVARDAVQVTVVNPVVSDADVADAATAIAKVVQAFTDGGTPAPSSSDTTSSGS